MFWSFLFTKELIWFNLVKSVFLPSEFVFRSKQVLWSKGNAVWPILSFMVILIIFTKNSFFDFACVFIQVLVKRQYGLTSAIFSLESNFECCKYWNSVWTMYIIQPPLFDLLYFKARLPETFGNKYVKEAALLDSTALWNFTV